MDTRLASRSREVVVSIDRPFVIIGERINPTGRRVLAAEMKEGRMDRVRADAIAQVAAGAHMLDINAGIPMADEPALLVAAIRAVAEVTDAPICIDSSIIEALEAGLSAYEGKALVNSVTAEEERMERIFPLVKKHGAAVIGMANDETGITMVPEERLALARRIIERAADYGIPQEDVIIDPIAMTVAADPTAGQVTLAFWEPEKEGLEFTPDIAGFAVRVDDIESAKAELGEKGAQIVGQGDTGVCHMVVCVDPDENAVILHHRYKPYE